jgi:hypothetical protein
MPRPSHASRFHHPYNIGWGVQITLDALQSKYLIYITRTDSLCFFHCWRVCFSACPSVYVKMCEEVRWKWPYLQWSIILWYCRHNVRCCRYVELQEFDATITKGKGLYRVWQRHFNVHVSYTVTTTELVN